MPDSNFGDAIRSHHEGTGDSLLIIELTDLITGGASHGNGIHSVHRGTGDLTTTLLSSTITTAGDNANGIFSLIEANGVGDITVELKRSGRSIIATEGTDSTGIVTRNQSGGKGDTEIILERARITSEGNEGYGISVRREGVSDGYGTVHIDFDDAEIRTRGPYAKAIFVRNESNPGTGRDTDTTIEGSNSIIVTRGGPGGEGIRADSGSGATRIDLEDVIIRTRGTGGVTASHGILGQHTGTGDVHIETTRGEILTRGAYSYGIFARHGSSNSDGRPQRYNHRHGHYDPRR